MFIHTPTCTHTFSLPVRGLWKGCQMPSAWPVTSRAESWSWESDLSPRPHPSVSALFLQPAGLCLVSEEGGIPSQLFPLGNWWHLKKVPGYPHSQISEKPLSGGSMKCQSTGGQAIQKCHSWPTLPLLKRAANSLPALRVSELPPQQTLHNWHAPGDLKDRQGRDVRRQLHCIM